MQGRKRFTVAGTRGWQGVGAGMLAAALALLAPLAHAGPFGLEQGMRLERLKQVAGLKDEGEFLYSTTRLPRTHPDFTDFRLLVTPEQGLCKLTAWTDPIPTNTYGEGVRRKYASLLAALEARYGAHKKFDFLRAGSIWDEPRDWMMGLLREERTLATYWDNEEGSRMSDRLVSVSLRAHAVSTSQGLIQLTYEFENMPACIAEIRRRESSAL